MLRQDVPHGFRKRREAEGLLQEGYGFTRVRQMSDAVSIARHTDNTETWVLLYRKGAQPGPAKPGHNVIGQQHVDASWIAFADLQGFYTIRGLQHHIAG